MSRFKDRKSGFVYFKSLFFLASKLLLSAITAAKLITIIKKYKFYFSNKIADGFTKLEEEQPLIDTKSAVEIFNISRNTPNCDRRETISKRSKR